MKHRRKVPFSPAVPVDSEVRNIFQKIHDLDHELSRFVLTADNYLELVTESYASNIHWSTKLEGNPLSEGEVLRLTRETLSGIEGESNPGPQQEIVNHLYGHFFQDKLRLPWSLQTIGAVHMMLSEGTGTSGAPGELRRTQVSIMEQGEKVFVPCPPEYVREELRSLLDWLNSYGQSLEALVCA
ncbi:MAG: Fic family protein, partial [Methanomassiliicoccales archaeon]|nr:Fic family protein [Methanomassiliicoccales archaeon]